MEISEKTAEVGMCAVAVSHLICHGLLKENLGEDKLELAVATVEKATGARELYQALETMVEVFSNGKNIQFGTMSHLDYCIVLKDARDALKIANPLGERITA